jgi:hypothetical protein
MHTLNVEGRFLAAWNENWYGYFNRDEMKSFCYFQFLQYHSLCYSYKNVLFLRILRWKEGYIYTK